MKYYSPAPIDPVSRVLCQFAPTWVPLGRHWQPNGNPLATHNITTMAKNGFSTGNNWVTKPRFQ